MNLTQTKPKIVVIGGGSGVSTLLSKFKKVAYVIAVVSMMDSGGSIFTLIIILNGCVYFFV